MTNKIDWNRNQPIVKFLRRWIPTVFPIIHRQKPEGRGIGGYENKLTEFGNLSDHAEGRAADIYLIAKDVTQKKIGDGLFEIFKDRHLELGVSQVIWNRQIWTKARETEGVRKYNGKKAHTDHVHISFTRNGSQLQPTILLPLLDNLCLDIFGTMDGQEVPPKQ